MARPEPDVEEAARRIRAAMAYSRVGRVPLADALNISPSALDRWTKGTTGQWRNVGWGDLWVVADTCDLPREWFSADLDRLAEIVPADLPRFDGVSPSRREAAERAAAATQAAAQRRRERPEQPPASRPGRDASERRS